MLVFFVKSERMEVPSNEKYSWMLFFKLGIGAFCLGVRNFNCVIGSVGHYCDYALLYSDRSGLSLVTVPSGKKILKRRNGYENCCLPSAVLLKGIFSLGFSGKKMRKRVAVWQPFFFHVFWDFSLHFLWYFFIVFG